MVRGCVSEAPSRLQTESGWRLSRSYWLEARLLRPLRQG